MDPFDWKLGEAHFFLDGLKASVTAASESGEKDELMYYLSAFLASSRSVLQYIYEDAKVAKRLPDYNAVLAKTTLASYFKTKRDANIHRKRPPEARMTGHVSVSIGAFIVAVGKAGAIENKLGVANEIASVSSSRAEDKYSFALPGAPVPGDLVTLCEKYLDEVEGCLKNARSIGLV